LSQKVKDKIKRWRDDPVYFVRDQFGVDPDKWQAEVLNEFAKNKRIAMKACKGPGKTCVLAWLAWNFLATRPHPKVAATSISKENLADGLWAEMAKWQHKSKWLQHQFIWTKTRIFAKDHPETWFMSARAWSKTADASKQSDTLAGLHADYILFIIDEVGGVPDSVMAAAEAALATGIDVKLMIAGNPTHTSGPLYRACTSEKHLWYVVEITSDPDSPMRSERVDIQWARDQITKYGRDNPWVLVNVFGQFPPESMNALFGVEEVNASMRRTVKLADYHFSQRRLGIDVARFGDDSTVIFPRQGLMAFKPVQMRGARTNDIAARVAEAKIKWRSELEFVDDTGGFGAGVIDSMYQASYSPIAVNFSQKADQPRYFNKRSEMWYRTSEWVKRGGCLPNIPELVGELCCATYTLYKGKLRVVEKAIMKEELTRSPDFADALCLTFAYKEMPAASTLPGLSDASSKLLTEFDPFDEKRL